MSVKDPDDLSTLDMMAEDVQAEDQGDGVSHQLGRISALYDQASMLESAIEEQEDRLAQLRMQRDKIMEGDLPAIFDEIGLQQVTLSNGVKLGIKTSYRAGITKEHHQACMDWLKEHGHFGMVRWDVSTPVRPGDDEQLDAVRNALSSVGVAFSEKEWVHHSTLRAFVKEQIESGEPLPQDLFSVNILRAAQRQK